MKSSSRVGLFLGALLISVGCSTQRVSSENELTQKEVTNDINTLTNHLSRTYSGYWFYFNDQEKDRLNAALTAIPQGPLSVQELCKRVGAALDILPDGHLFAQTDGTVCGDKPSYVDVGQNLSSELNQPYLVENKVVDEIRIGVVAIRSFTNHDEPAWRDFLDQVHKIITTSDHLIVDLRGNRGGDSWFAEQLPLLVFNRSVNPYERQKKVQTPQALQLQINAFDLQIQNYREKKRAVPKALTEHRRYFTDLQKKAQENTLPQVAERSFPGEPHLGDGKAFSGHLVVLIDGKCGSACEVAALNLKSDSTTFVGVNTDGLVHFGNPGILVLPHSSIRVSIPSGFSSLRNDVFLEEKGLSPDVRLSNGEDAFSKAVEITRTLLR